MHLDGCGLEPDLPASGWLRVDAHRDRKSTRLNSSHSQISYAVFCFKKNTRPGVVQRWPTNRSPAVRSVQRWKPRSLTSKPVVVVLSANTQLELPPSLLMEKSATTPESDVRCGS